MSELLDDAGVAQKMHEIWPEVAGWVGRSSSVWRPHPASPLGLDDQATALEASNLALTSLAVGSEALQVALTYLNNHGPTVSAARALLRTALVGGAQTVWLLSPDESEERVSRVRMVQRESVYRYREWLKDFEGLTAYDGVVDVPGVRDGLSEISERIGPGDRSNMTRMVREATRHAFAGDEQIVAAAMLEWRSASGLAHADGLEARGIRSPRRTIFGTAETCTPRICAASRPVIHSDMATR